MKQAATRHGHDKARQQIERVRRICLALPEASEKLSHGEPTWFVRKRVFAMFSSNHHNDGHISVLIPAAMGVQSMLIEADHRKFYRPPYVGVRGWVGIELDQVGDEELTVHLGQAWRLIAPARLHSLQAGCRAATKSDRGQVRSGTQTRSP